MGDLGRDTAVESVSEHEGGGRFAAVLSRDWEIWGPNGGYVAAVALRAAGASSPFRRPASLSCHFLGVAAFDQVDIEVRHLRAARTALSQRVEITQQGRAILEAIIWSVGDIQGLEHDHSAKLDPGVPGPDGVADIAEHLTEEEKEQGPPYAFWTNFDVKPIRFHREQPEVLEPVWQEWIRFAPGPDLSDPWIDACRSVILIDVQSWPAASGAHRWGHGFIAPSLDLYVGFHDPRPESEWLLADGFGPVARDGLMGWNGRLWSEDRRLVATGSGQCLCRPAPQVNSAR